MNLPSVGVVVSRSSTTPTTRSQITVDERGAHFCEVAPKSTISGAHAVAHPPYGLRDVETDAACT